MTCRSKIMIIISFNYYTDDAQMLSEGWRFILRSFTSLPLLETHAVALSRSGFDNVNFEVKIVEDENPAKNMMGSAPPKRGPGRPKKEDSAKKAKLS